MPWFRPTVGIALADGVGELDATAAFEVYGQSAAARTVALAAGDTVRTRHGLVLLTTSYAHAPGLSRVVVPGAASPEAIDPRLRSVGPVDQALTRGTPQGRVHRGLQNLADHTDAATTSATAKMIGYPTTGLHLGDQHGSWRTVLLTIGALLLAVLVGLTPAFLVRRRRRRALQVGGLAVASSRLDPESARENVSVRS